MKGGSEVGEGRRKEGSQSQGGRTETESGNELDSIGRDGTIP